MMGEPGATLFERFVFGQTEQRAQELTQQTIRGAEPLRFAASRNTPQVQVRAA